MILLVDINALGGCTWGNIRADMPIIIRNLKAGISHNEELHISWYMEYQVTKDTIRYRKLLDRNRTNACFGD